MPIVPHKIPAAATIRYPLVCLFKSIFIPCLFISPKSFNHNLTIILIVYLYDLEKEQRTILCSPLFLKCMGTMNRARPSPPPSYPFCHSHGNGNPSFCHCFRRKRGNLYSQRSTSVSPVISKIKIYFLSKKKGFLKFYRI